MARSYQNKILYVDLSSGKTRVEEPGPVYFRRYLGGWNIILDTLLRSVAPGAEPLGPENKLVFATGVLTGLPISGAARHAVGAKSPLTGGFGAAESGGFFGTELKQAGFDALVVEGASPEPVYLWIRDGEVELRPAAHLWGQTTKETLAAIRTELGDSRIRCSLIGPGAENLVRFANVMDGLHDAAGRTGLGAVMGSKRLKAVAVRGSSRVGAADPERLGALARELVPKAKQIGWLKHGTGGHMTGLAPNGNTPVHNLRGGVLEGAAHLDLVEHIVGMEGCYGCATRCKIQVAAGEPYHVDPAYGGPEYETVASLGPCCGVTEGLAIAEAGALCNAYSLDTITTGYTIAFAMECFENGLLTEEDTCGIDLRFGNASAVVQMVEKIAKREGLGDLLAQGPARAARRIGGGAERYAVHVKNQSYPAHEPRIQRGLAIGYAVSPTGADHNQSLMDGGLRFRNDDGFLAHRRLRSMGILESMDLESLGPEKVRAVIYNSMVSGVLNTLPFCLFVALGVDMPLSDLVDITQAATGWDINAYELLKAGERAYALARVFNTREGLTAQDDRLAERSYGPTENGPLVAAGLDREKLEEAVHLYYSMMGWDEQTGVPLPAKLHELGVSWAIDYLPKRIA
jgi:aldehyde:ferredoxin oxidoreductase